MTMFASTFRWLQRKRYQYEVTFSLYMLTPTEKFIFNSFLFLFFSMVIIAMTLYLPQHIAFLTNRAWFYYNGDESAKTAVKSVIESPTGAVLVQKVKESVVAASKAGGTAGSTLLGAGKEL
ncbi:hypothetical protein ONS95_013097 [Cadophora gregata]|uniref:uncharacterized protein n=1 Tax=Cadophora gregata TaxID=51156 RepID=UPI0026DC028F|nr:uncharacterized protein ONS95_013097 [Cadophora gregata]KAK0100091.1 hypothetical protein ONS96_008026 [Cadophora gregata f. sp. sojae]KAK0116065.1 hypothetical protein ONS95_013097 [Cadophora gregata]